jgi:hypothetical protein
MKRRRKKRADDDLRSLSVGRVATLVWAFYMAVALRACFNVFDQGAKAIWSITAPHNAIPSLISVELSVALALPLIILGACIIALGEMIRQLSARIVNTGSLFETASRYDVQMTSIAILSVIAYLPAIGITDVVINHISAGIR